MGTVVGAVVTIIFFAPARWLAAVLRDQTQGYVLLVNPRGTVWNGVANVVFASGAGGAESVSLPGLVSWKLRPHWGGASAALDIPCCATQPLGFVAQPQGNGLRLAWADGQSRWPAAMLTGFGAPWNSLKPEGMLDLSTQSLVIHFKPGLLALEGRASVDATDLAIGLSTVRPLGSYHVAIEGGPAPTLLLTTREGSLQLNGSGQWTGRAMRFSGEASAAPGREAALSNLLNIIGRRDGARSLITLG